MSAWSGKERPATSRRSVVDASPNSRWSAASADAVARARLIGAYGRWAVLHRVRREHRDRDVTVNAARWARHRITIAREFLAWLDHVGIDLAELTQVDIEAWLDKHSGASAYDIEIFIDWLQQRHLLAHQVTVPARKRRTTVDPLDDQSHWRHVERCIRDTDMPLDLRCAGLLMLLYGQRITDIAQLKPDQLVIDDTGVSLKLNRQPVILPPVVGELLVQLLTERDHSPMGRAAEAQQRWLFPGHRPGRPAAATTIARRLRALGIPVTPARLTALLHMTEDLPSAVVAELLGYDIQTTDKWSRLQKPDWSRYLKARQTSPEQGISA